MLSLLSRNVSAFAYTHSHRRRNYTAHVAGWFWRKFSVDLAEACGLESQNTRLGWRGKAQAQSSEPRAKLGEGVQNEAAVQRVGIVTQSCAKNKDIQMKIWFCTNHQASRRCRVSFANLSLPSSSFWSFSLNFVYRTRIWPLGNWGKSR